MYISIIYSWRDVCCFVFSSKFNHRLMTKKAYYSLQIFKKRDTLPYQAYLLNFEKFTDHPLFNDYCQSKWEWLTTLNFPRLYSIMSALCTTAVSMLCVIQALRGAISKQHWGGGANCYYGRKEGQTQTGIQSNSAALGAIILAYANNSKYWHNRVNRYKGLTSSATVM